MNKRTLILASSLALALSACTTTGPDAKSDPAAKRQSIDSAVDSALSKLYSQVPGSREMVGRSRAVLVFPSVVSAGFVVGGSYGEGALRTGGKTTGYYSTTAAAAGLLAGAESKALYVLFMNEESLKKFLASKGWTAGVDASVTLINVGAAAGTDTRTAQQPVVGYALSNAGLMANLSVDGTKVNRLDL
jgi:lipid-binding SYLF domain-containing protein